ncbi:MULTISPECIES: hypothetical protein [Prochlorococcus]|uniref:hypothetical protein n=1 Tax=Prochlorococcus TaxID=1218 RepID=UPI0007B3853F|nr:hypothetical protein [Prochlorococcus marinus]KZR81560.1 hypothetical protein PMIT1327_01070 [Prochlorococcus marinus str. MIT 1327]
MHKIKKGLLHHYPWSSLQRKATKGEEGLALLLALLTGLTLLTGATGLFIRQLMARKLGAAESYQQMAEAAAVNGFNRILSKLNQNDPENYRGFLFTLDNLKNTNNPNDGFFWELINTTEAQHLEELCTDTSMGLPIHPSSEEAQWPTGHMGKGNTETFISVPFIDDKMKTQRKDKKGSIQTFYRLRDYSSPGKNGLGEGVFQIEGIVKRVGTSDEDYLARTLLTRSLYVSSSIVKPEDWGILAAKHFDLGATEIEGDGIILWHVDENIAAEILKSDRSGCKDDLLSRINGSSNSNVNRIWPIMGRDKPSSLSTILFGDNKTGEKNNDFYPGSSNIERVWSFDDTGNKQSEFYCGEEKIVCTRAKNGKDQTPPEIEVTSKAIGTDTSDSDQPSKNQAGQNSLTSSKGITKTYTPVDRKKDANLFCHKNTCKQKANNKWVKIKKRNNAWEFSKKNYFPRKEFWWTNEIVRTDFIDEAKSWTVRIKQEDICIQQSNKSVACHIYVEHMDLENTKVFIENNKRPVVIHLELPPDDSKFISGLSSGRIELSDSSKLCGVNSGEVKCNNKPERLVISQAVSSESLNCYEKRLKGDNANAGSSLQSILSIAGNSLPAAWVSLTGGTFTLTGDATMNGVVWAKSFCSQNNKLYLSTKSSDNDKGSVVQAADELWEWNEKGLVQGHNALSLGRTITRGVRGTGLDMFRRW